MKIDPLALRWTPATVSWLSFVIMGLVVAGVGLTGTAHVVGYLHDRLTAHGIGHDREIAEHLRPLLEPRLTATPEPSPAALQEAVATYGAFGYRVFVIDRVEGRLMADSGATVDLPLPLEASWLAGATHGDGRCGSLPLQEGAGTVLCEEGHPMLVWLADMGTAGEGMNRWLLGVASDQKTMKQFLGDLHWHLDGIMLLTYVLIALLGYFSMRSIGRTYERNLEAQVRERSLALEAAHQEMLRKARLATIGQTASVLTHEMRNPLASIKLALAGLKGVQTLPERERRRVGLVLGEVDRLDALLSETLDYVRPIKLSTKPVVLDRLLTRVIHVQKPLADARQVSIRREPCSDCKAIRLDENKMHQVLLNLLKNAVEASPQGGEIGIRPFRDGSEVVLEITNGGEVVDPDTLERAFEPFFTTKPKGSGLGLGLVKRVVEEHGGRVQMTSDGQSGTRVTLRLPMKVE
jgi:signal transduction histidine kinase